MTEEELATPVFLPAWGIGQAAGLGCLRAGFSSVNLVNRGPRFPGGPPAPARVFGARPWAIENRRFQPGKSPVRSF